MAADGAKQVAALGGQSTYNARIDNVVPQMVVQAIAACKGRFHDLGNNYGWMVLTQAANVQVAHRGKADFSPHDLFYLATGSESETKNQYKSAKKLLVDRWYRRSAAPFEGPYFK